MIDNDDRAVIFSAVRNRKPFAVDGKQWPVASFEDCNGITTLHGIRIVDSHQVAYQDQHDRWYAAMSCTYERATITLDADSACLENDYRVRLFRVKVETEIEVDNGTPIWARNARKIG